MNFVAAAAYIAKRRHMSRTLGSAGHRVRRPHWHPHSFVCWDDGVKCVHRPYWPLRDHERISVFVVRPSSSDATCDDWEPYAEPIAGSADYDKAYRGAMAAQKRGFK